MNEWYEQAKWKLETEKNSVCEALERIKVTDRAKAGKLQSAIRAVVEGMA